jgi:hypothetical protein
MKVHVTVHSIARYAQRVLRTHDERLDDESVLADLGEETIERIRAAILDVCADVARVGGRGITCGGIVYVIDAGRIVTLYATGAVDLDARPERLKQALKAWRPAEIGAAA